LAGLGYPRGRFFYSGYVKTLLGNDVGQTAVATTEIKYFEGMAVFVSGIRKKGQ
jgi:hypothetical protein